MEEYYSYSPEHNEGARTLFVDIVTEPVGRDVERLFMEDVSDPFDMWDRIGFLKLVLERGIEVQPWVMEVAIERIDQLLNSDFYNAWDEPKKWHTIALANRRWLAKLLEKLYSEQ